MRMFCRNLTKNSIFQNNVFKNNSTLLQRKSLSANFTPIKMAVDVYASSGTRILATPILLLHGMFGSKEDLKTIGRKFGSITDRVIFNADARNHGVSPHVTVHNLASMAEDVKCFMTIEDREKVCLIGHGMGGRTAMFLALNHPELVEKMVIIDVSPVSIPRDPSQMDRIFRAMKCLQIPSKLSLEDGQALAEEEMIKLFPDKETCQIVLSNLKKQDCGKFFWRCNVKALRTNYAEYTKKLCGKPFHGPTLFIAANQSPFIKPADWPEIKQLFPNATIEWFDTGHLVFCDEPKRLVDTVEHFLRM